MSEPDWNARAKEKVSEILRKSPKISEAGIIRLLCSELGLNPRQAYGILQEMSQQGTIVFLRRSKREREKDRKAVANALKTIRPIPQPLNEAERVVRSQSLPADQQSCEREISIARALIKRLRARAFVTSEDREKAQKILPELEKKLVSLREHLKGIVWQGRAVKFKPVSSPYVEISRLERTQPMGLINELLSFLAMRNYETERSGHYIIARHKYRHKVILIKLTSLGSFFQYRKVRTVVLTVSAFMTFVRQLERRAGEAGTIDPSELRSDVITAFGWHANVDEDRRHMALELASEIWEPPHILNLLEMLNNLWANNPVQEHNAPVAKADHRWLERELSTGVYRTEKRELVAKLEDELVSLGIPPQFQRFIRGAEDIDRWFVVTY